MMMMKMRLMTVVEGDDSAYQRQKDFVRVDHDDGEGREIGVLSWMRERSLRANGHGGPGGGTLIVRKGLLRKDEGAKVDA